MKRILRLDWDKCSTGYDVAKRQGHSRAEYVGTLLEEAATHPGGEIVVARSAFRVPYQTEGLDEPELACLALANAPRTPDGVVRFARDWGLLYGFHEEPLGDVYEMIDQLNLSIHQLQVLGGRLFLQGLRPNARTGVKERYIDGKVYGLASCLAVFCRHQILELAEADREIRRCDFCNRVYVVGLRTGKRREHQKPRFCSEKCRKKNHTTGADEVRG
jgi:hypothetical protein